MTLNLYTLPEVAARLGVSEPTVRRAIRQEVDANTRDSIRFVPGGRVSGQRYLVFADIFDAVVSGRCIEITDPRNVNPVSFLVRRNDAGAA